MSGVVGTRTKFAQPNLRRNYQALKSVVRRKISREDKLLSLPPVESNSFMA
jgi:hypothetical protein